jgi:hypothetical protein
MTEFLKRGFTRSHVSCFLTIALFSSLLVPDLGAQQGGAVTPGAKKNSPNLAVFQKGEELVYEVSYMSIALGTISCRVLSVDTSQSAFRISLEGLVRTYAGVPFVTLNTHFRSVLGSSLQSTAFRNKEYIRDDTVYKTIEYIYPQRKDVVHISETLNDRPGWIRSDTLDLEGKKWQDGLSLLFYARAFAHTRQSKQVPVLMYRDKATTVINFGIKREEEDIDALDDPVRTVKLEGETGFTGLFGLTGGFEGWFSDDAAAVPIHAKMHVLIGSVHIELLRWKRSSWKPPVVKD